MRSLPIIALVALAGCRGATPAQAARDDDDIALLWSARSPGDSGGLTVLVGEAVPWNRVPRRGLDEADTAAPVLPVLDGALHFQVQDGLAGEDLVIVGPPSKFLATTESPSDSREQMGGERDVTIRLPVERGSSAAAVVEVASEVLAGRMQRARQRGRALSVAGASSVISIDVIWPTGADEPTLTVTLSRGGVVERTTASGARVDIPIE